MKSILATLFLLASLSQAQIVTPAGRTQWGDSLRWGDSNDSTSYYLFRGNSMFRDSSSTWVATADSCTRPTIIARGSQMPAGKLELTYEVRASAGNTDSTQVKWRVDSRYCLDERRSLSCDTWVPAGRWKGDSTAAIIDSIVSVATADGVTWRPTRQIFDVPGGNQIRFCVDAHQAGGATGDSTFFRRHVVRTSSIPAGGLPSGGGSASSVTVTSFPDNEPINVAQINGVTPLMGNGVTGTGSQRVTIASDNTAFAVNPAQATASSLNAEVQGDAAHDAAISGNPVRQGLRARTADYTGAAQDDAVDAIATITGKQVVLPYSIPGERWSYAAASGGITNTTAVTVKAAVASVKNCITSIQVINGHATVSTETLVLDGAAGTVIHRGFAQAAGGGYAIQFPVPICGTANTLLEVDNVTTGAAVYYNLQGYEAEE